MHAHIFTVIVSLLSLWVFPLIKAVLVLSWTGYVFLVFWVNRTHLSFLLLKGSFLNISQLFKLMLFFQCSTGVLSPVISRNHSTSVCFVHLTDFLLHLCFSEKFSSRLFNFSLWELLQKILTDMEKFCLRVIVYSLFLFFLMVLLNFRMHSTSSHDGHKHHRSQTLPIIRGKNALSNPKLLQMIDSSTASKYKKLFTSLWNSMGFGSGSVQSNLFSWVPVKDSPKRRA